MTITASMVMPSTVEPDDPAEGKSVISFRVGLEEDACVEVSRLLAFEPSSMVTVSLDRGGREESIEGEVFSDGSMVNEISNLLC